MIVAELSGSDLAAVLVSVAAAVAVGALLVAVGALVRAARQLRHAARRLDEEATSLLVELREAAARTDAEVDRLETILSSAESITGTVDAASKLAYRAVSNPVVKTMAFASGTNRAARKLRGVEEAPAVAATSASRPAPGTSRRTPRRARKGNES